MSLIPGPARRRDGRRVAASVSVACAVAAGTAVLPATRVLATTSPWTTRTSMPTSRQGLATVAGPGGLIYAIGGTNGTYLGTVESYSPSANAWTSSLAAMPTPRDGLGAATGTDGLIYAIGGWDGAPTNVVEAYDPVANTWSTTKTSMPTARSGLAVVTGSDGRIYALGGKDGYGTALSTAEAYTPSTNTWAGVASMPTAHSDFAAAEGADGRIYAIGGVDSTGSDTSEVDAYTPGTNSWAVVASLPTLRYGLAAATGAGGLVYAIGGYGGPGYLNIVEAFNPATNAWSGEYPMPTARFALGAVTDSDGAIYAIGGNDGSYLQTVEAYQVPATATTTTVTSSANSAAAGQTVTYTATVAPVPDGGTMAFTDNGTSLSGCGAVTVNTTTGIAACTTGYSAQGTHAIVAAYSGDPTFAASSGSLTEQVTLTVQETSAAVTCDSWVGVTYDAASGGTYRTSATKGATATFKFSGTGVSWVTRTGPDQGIATVTIDGVSKGTFDLYTASPQSLVSKSFTGFAAAKHKIVVKVSGTKNAASTGASVAVDAFVVGAATTQDSSPSVTYDLWTGVTSAAASGGSYRINGKAKATCGTTFTGTEAQWITATGPAYGQASVSIDGLSKGTVDLYASTVHWQVAETYSGLSSGSHTILVTVLGTKNASSKGTKVVVDAFVIWQA